MAHLVNVTVISTDQNGNPVVGARVSVRLNQADVDPDDGYIAPETKTAVTGADGTVVIQLWPNARGSTQSQYECAIPNPDTGRTARFYATIPDSDCILHEVANLPPYPGKSDGQLVIDAAVAAVAPAVAARLGAEAAQGAAEDAASSASADAATASTAASNALTAKGAAESARNDAVAASSAAVTAQGAAESARDAAQAALADVTPTADAAVADALSNIILLGFASEYDATPDVGAGSVTIHFKTNGQKQRLTLAGNTTINIDTTGLPVGNYQIRLIQDGTGGRTVTFGAPVSASRWLGSSVQPSIHPGGNGETIVMFYWDGLNFIQSLAKVGAS